MPNPTRPTDQGFWGGTAITPTTPQRTTGWTPNFRPPSQWWNWWNQLMYSWIQWLDFVTQAFASVAITPVPQEEATFVVGNTWQLLNPPVSTATTSVWVDGQPQIGNWAVVGNQIIFSADTPVAGQTVTVDYYISATANLVAFLASNSGAYTVYASTGAPTQVTALGGVPATADARQLRFISSDGGAVVVTAAPQIQAGTAVGQEMRLVGTSDADYITLNDALAGSGIKLQGLIQLKNNVTLDLFWNGAVWAEAGRNV